MYKVMIVEDDEIIRYVYSKMKSWGKNHFFINQEASNGIHALEELKEDVPDVIFTDIRMPLMGGIELMKQVRETMPEIPVVLISSYNDFEYAREGIRLGAVDYIVKPMEENNLDEVLMRLKEILDKKPKNNQIPWMEEILDENAISDPFILKVCQYLEEHMYSSLTMEEVAEAMNLNKDYMGKQIKAKTGLSFRNLYNQAKIAYAKPLIKNGQYKVYEVSELLGYTSTDYFTQLFKSIVHMTPAEYKKIDIL